MGIWGSNLWTQNLKGFSVLVKTFLVKVLLGTANVCDHLSHAIVAYSLGDDDYTRNNWSYILYRQRERDKTYSTLDFKKALKRGRN